MKVGADRYGPCILVRPKKKILILISKHKIDMDIDNQKWDAFLKDKGNCHTYNLRIK